MEFSMLLRNKKNIEDLKNKKQDSRYDFFIFCYDLSIFIIFSTPQKWMKNW